MESLQSLFSWARERRWLLLLLPPLLAFVVHASALGGDLIWDDESLILEHPRLGEAGFYKEIFRRDYGLEFAPRTPTGYYRPVLMAANIGLFNTFGRSTVAYHAAVLVVFCFCAFLFTWIAREIFGDERWWLALAVGCLVAVHPIRTEYAVFFMSMPDVLLEIFALLIVGAVLAVPRYLTMTPAACLAGGVAFLAALTKETSFLTLGAMGGCLVLASMIAKNHRQRWPLGFVVLAGLALGVVFRRWEGVATPDGAAQLAQLPVGSGRAFYAIVLALRDVLIPNYTVFMRWNSEPTSAATIFASFGLIAASAALVIWLLRKDQLFPALISSWIAGGMLALMLIRSSNLPYADRYVPSGALILGLGLLANRWWPARDGRSAAARRLAAILLTGYIGISAVFGWLSTVRCVNALAFFTAMAEDEPQLVYPRLELANLWFFRYGDFARMEQNIREAAAIAPDVPAVRAAGKLLAKRYIVEKRYAQGLRALDWAAEAQADDAELWSLRAACHAGLRDYPQALAAIERALQLRPDHPPYQKQRERIAMEAGAVR